MFYDILHGINELSAPLGMTLELAILLGFDGQLKQDSDMEMELFQSIIKQLGNFGLEGKEQALVWLYVTTWNKHGEHILDYGDLWTFTDNDMEAALITMAYPKKEDPKIEELKGIIMDRFNNDTFEFYKWSLNISKVAIAEIKQRKEGTKRKKEIFNKRNFLKKKKDRRRWSSNGGSVLAISDTSSTDECSLTDS